MKSLEHKIPPPLVALLAAVLMWWLQGFYPLSLLAGGTGRTLAMLSVTVGVMIAAVGITAFRKAKTTVDPLHPGKASAIVDSGIFAYTRNPMYLGMSLVLLGVCFHLAELTAFLILALFIRFISRYQIQPEERILLEKFGEPYQAYLDKVPRWI
jgi:protein-S-isoprenylcysteine O-methyltransferase Ste14